MPTRLMPYVLRTLALTAVAAAGTSLFFYSPRLAALPVAAVVVLSGGWWVFRTRWQPLAVASVVYAGVTLAPIDVRPQHWFGAPTIIPVVMGYPSAALGERAKRDEVWLGGCVVSGTEPKLVVVW